jgi:hypothetical protein
VGERIILWKRGLYGRIERTLVSARKITAKFEIGVKYTMFPLRNIVSIKGILPIYQRFHREETFTLGNIGIYC